MDPPDDGGVVAEGEQPSDLGGVGGRAEGLPARDDQLGEVLAEGVTAIAQRLERFAAVVGPERVIASTDCGFGTFVGYGRVGGQVARMKLGAMADGAALVRV